MSDPRRVAKCIPQLLWAIIKAMRHHYSTVCTKEDLDPTDGDLPHFPTTNLDAYTFLLKAELPIKVDGIPAQWLPAHKQPTQTPPTTTAKPTNRTDTQPRQPTQYPFAPNSTTTAITCTYQNQPAVFANNEVLRELKTKRGQIMRDLIEKAGIAGGERGLNLTGLPENICLRYLLLGQCHSLPINECKQNHPMNEINKEGTESLLKQLEPALKWVGDKPKWQHTE